MCKLKLKLLFLAQSTELFTPVEEGLKYLVSYDTQLVTRIYLLIPADMVGWFDEEKDE